MWPGVGLCECRRGQGRLRTVSYFALQSYCTWNPSKRAANPRAAINEGVSPRRKIKNERPSFLVWSHITSWFAITLAEIRTRRILEKGRTESSLGTGGRPNSPLFSTSDQIVLGKRKSSKFNLKNDERTSLMEARKPFFSGLRNACASFGHRRLRSKRGLWQPCDYLSRLTWKQRRRRRHRERQKSNRCRLAKQQLCTCITLFYTFLCRRFTTATWKCL